ncbi:MAG: hypothetical protein V3T58_06200 [Candidatus Hydrothermarchaeales archaeon]
MEYTLTQPIPTSKLEDITLDELKIYYKKYRAGIGKRLMEFQEVLKASEDRIFGELCFCILTPQSNARLCDRALGELFSNETSFQPKIHRERIEEALHGVRFRRKKAGYILNAWERFTYEGGELSIKKEMTQKLATLRDNRALRDWFRGEMKGNGIGLKEASHFLRNIGLGKDLAILDRHILSCLEELRALEGALNPASKAKGITETQYRGLEEIARTFSKEVGIPMIELDLLLWSARTGYIFK